MDNQELIDTARRNEWTLECDRKVLQIMQNLASKIESRATTTKAKMNNMILSLDETKVKMSNLTRINDIKNTVYCENLITDDHLEPIQEVPKTTVKLSTNIAIQNGLKLMENCFEKHRVNLDPSSNRSEISTVFRPIDKFYSPLPYMIGDKNWKEKWHVGLVEEDKYSHTGSTYAESVGSNITSNSRVESDHILASESNLMASQTSLSKSSSSIGDQMIINKQVGLFDEVYASEQITPSIKQPTTNQSTFFAPQQSERKIVNLFDDEPPELTVESSHNRKPVNLFDDVDSVLSMPLPEPDMNEKPLPPVVDLFNDNEFDNFIQKIESSQQRNQTETPKKVETMKDNMQRDMRNIAAEIKNVQLRKTENVIRADTTVNKTVLQTPQADKKVVEQQKIDKQEIIKTEILPEQKTQNTVNKNTDPVIKSEAKSTPTVKTCQKITNLFDDDDDESEDFFTEIIKQKSQQNDSKLSQIKKEEPIMYKSTPETKKNVNLFDDEDDDDFESIFNKKPSINVSTPRADKSLSNTEISKESELHKVHQTQPSISRNLEIMNETETSYDKPQTIDKIITNKRHKNLFEDDEDDENDNAKSNKSLFNSKELTNTELGQESKNNISEIESEQAMGGYLSTVKDYIFNQSDEVIESTSSITHEDSFKNDIVDKIEENQSIKENDLIKPNKSNVIIANCPDDDNDVVPNIKSEPENQNTVVNDETEKNNIEYETRTNDDAFLSKKFNNPVLFLDNEPPDDDDDWDTEDNNFEEPEIREVMSQNTSNYLAFNEIPPDDDYIDQSVDDVSHIDHDDENDDFLEIKPDKPLQKTFKKESFDDIFSPKSHKKDFVDEKLPHSSIFGDESDNEIPIPKLNEYKLPLQDEISHPEIKSNEISKDQKTITELLPNKDTLIDDFDILPKINNIQAKLDGEKDIWNQESNSIQKVNQSKSILAKNEALSTLFPQNENNLSKSNIKSKLDLFTKTPEQHITQDSPPKKLPGKLNKTLAINVNALMPGARVPKKTKPQSEESLDSTPSLDDIESSSSSTDKSFSEILKSKVEKVISTTEKSTTSESSGLLNNDLTKNRAKIQVKRRPSTRKGRQAIYDQTLNANVDKDSNENVEGNTLIDNVANEIKQTVIEEAITTQPTSLSRSKINEEITQVAKINNLTESISHVIKKENKEAKNIQNQKQVNVRSNVLDFFDDEPPPLDTFSRVEQEAIPKTGVISKSRIFYDDEDETRKMLEDEKKKTEAKPSTSLFDDNTKSIQKLANNIKQSLFDDDSDNDLFPAPKAVIDKPKKVEVEKKKVVSKPLFNDDDDDDLFGATQKKVPEKSAKLFDSDDENKLEGSIIFSKSTSSTKPKKQSIFGDDDYDDDDDLFSSKPKSSGSVTTPAVTKLPSLNTALKSTPLASVKKTASSVVNDPLKDLMGD